MKKIYAFLSPVEVVKVTSQNLAEVAQWCGGKVANVESRKVPGRMDSYVWVPTPKGTRVSWAFPGMYITRRLVVNDDNEIKETWAVFRRDYYDRNYFADPQAALNATWERAATEKSSRPVKNTPAPTEAESTDVTVKVATEAGDNLEKVTEKAIAKLREMFPEKHEKPTVIEDFDVAQVIENTKSAAHARMAEREEAVEEAAEPITTAGEAITYDQVIEAEDAHPDRMPR